VLGNARPARPSPRVRSCAQAAASPAHAERSSRPARAGSGGRPAGLPPPTQSPASRSRAVRNRDRVRPASPRPAGDVRGHEVGHEAADDDLLAPPGCTMSSRPSKSRRVLRRRTTERGSVACQHAQAGASGLECTEMRPIHPRRRWRRGAAAHASQDRTGRAHRAVASALRSGATATGQAAPPHPRHARITARAIRSAPFAVLTPACRTFDPGREHPRRSPRPPRPRSAGRPPATASRRRCTTPP
jgi:hypothetical protein